MFQNIIKCWQSGLNPDPDAYKCQQMGASGAPSTSPTTTPMYAIGGIYIRGQQRAVEGGAAQAPPPPSTSLMRCAAPQRTSVDFDSIGRDPNP